MYLTAGELVGIILSPTYGKLFRKFFAGPENIISAKLQEIATIRNALAHFRPVTPAHVKILRENGSVVLQKFQSQLQALLFTKKGRLIRSWKGSFVRPATENRTSIECRVGQPREAGWTVMQLLTNAKISSASTSENTCSFMVEMVSLQRLLAAFPELQNSCVVAREWTSIPSWDGDSSLPKITKIIRLAFLGTTESPDKAFFSNDQFPTGASSSEMIIQSTKNLTSKYRATATEQKIGDLQTRWKIQISKSISSEESQEFPEDWSCISSDFEDDPLTSIPRYPWMHTDTSPGWGF